MSSPFDTEEPVIIHFVTQFRRNEEECSDEMRMAFQVCSEQNLNPKWITEEACLKCVPAKTDVFVFQDFKGDAFSFLKSFACDCIVIGPRCILDCIRAGSLIPKGNTPLLTVAMRNLVITTTGFMGVADDLKASIIEKILYMGGTYCAEYRQSVTHLVAYKVLSEKYELAQENKIPVMTEEWISAIWEESQRRNVHATDDEFMMYKCPIFHKMLITCSQLPRRLKDEIRLKIDSNGGEFSGQLQSNKTTLLVVTKAEGEKYRYAQSWELPCVMPSWVMDSVEVGYALPLKNYLLGGSDNLKVSTPETTAPPLPDCSMSVIQGMASRIGETLLDNTVVSTATASVSPHVGKYMRQIDNLNMSLVKRAGSFIDGCNVYLSGFNPEYTEKLRRVLNSGGAIRFNEISETVTHVIVGDFVPSDIKVIKSCESRLHVVTIQWLIESVKLRSVAPEDKFSCYDALPSPIEQQSPLSKKGLLVLHNSQGSSSKHVRSLNMNSPVGKKENLEPRNLVQQYLQACRASAERNDSEKSSKESDLQKEKDDDATMMAVPDSALQHCRPPIRSSQNAPNSSLSLSYSSSVLTQTEIFKGLTFSVAGFNPGEVSSLDELIRSGAGQLVRQNFTGIPDYGIVPIGGANLKHTTTEVVTFLWVEDCCEEKQLQPIQYYHKPVPFDRESRPLEGCVLSITSYEGTERRFLAILIECLGGLNQAMFARILHPEHGGQVSTHLICPDTGETKSSRKFKAALKWGVPPVSHKWLLACANEEKKVDEESYRVIPQVYETPIRVRSSSSESPIRSSKRKFDDSGSSGFATPNPYDSSVLAQPGPSETPTFHTPKPPGYLATPETPYGQVFEENPSPNTRKEWKKWINQFPEYTNYQCPSPKQRRLSTPLCELRRKCWEKFGAGFCEETKTSKEDADSEIEEIPEPEKTKEVVEERAQGSEKQKEDALSEAVSQEVRNRETPESQKSSTPTQGAGINTQLLELDKILGSASRRINKEEAAVETKPNSEPPAPESLDVCGDLVEWVDPVVSNQNMRASKAKRTLLFMLTSLDDREYYEGVIRSLGGVVSTKQIYEKDSTHLVCLQPSRSEKLLSCIAAGKWVLDKSYLDDSKKAGHFLEEEPYEWGNPKAGPLMTRLKPDSLNHQLALAVYRWRCKIERTGQGAFGGMKAIVCTSPEKCCLYSRLIEAGGGEVLDISPPYSDPGEATLCIIEFAKVNCRVDLESLARHNVPCVPAMYLNNYLIYDPCPEPSSCLLEEYKAVLSTV